MVKALYRRLVPLSVRTPLWHLRSLARHTLRGGHRERRGDLANLYVSMGARVARVSGNGLTLSVDLRDRGVGYPLFVEERYEPAETRFLEATLKEGMCFVDVGANIGYYTTLAARLVGDSGRVVAIEPDPYNFSLLEKNVRANRLDNVILLNVAAGAMKGTGRLCRSATNFGDHRIGSREPGRNSVDVPIVPIDDLCDAHHIERVDVVKVDVQGYEFFAMQGMERFLRSGNNMTVMTEFWPRGIEQAGASPESYFRKFESLGFRAHVLTSLGEKETVTYEKVVEILPTYQKAFPISDAAWIDLIFERPSA
jgi:FkbM family methyltransferase